MNVLLLGSGGREHAIAWKISQSKKLTQLYIAPGNAGTQQHGINVEIDASEFEKLGAFVIEKDINLIISGPEAPLVAGIHDFFRQDSRFNHVLFAGPQKHGAMLEGSKEFAKEFMQRHAIPTARYLSVDKQSVENGIKFLTELKPPYVLKADGLAAGKGVLILDDLEEAKNELKAMLSGKFGQASSKVVIEEYLHGIELSIFILTDGKSYKILPEAKDYKRIGEGDTGLNTGGMGCISPVPFADKNFLAKIEERIIKSTVEGLQKDKIVYNGFIFFGLMNVDGEPSVIEYNVRMGDPEAEVVIPRLDCDLLELFTATANGTLDKTVVKVNPDYVATVMLVSGGYPGSYANGYEINGLENVDKLAFHAGTSMKDGKVVTNGGRVIAISAFGKTMKEALKNSYQGIEHVSFQDMYFRRDIGFDL